jgi:hypothetical protein
MQGASMENRTHISKIALAVWSPVIILAIAYGATYLIMNAQANHELTKQQKVDAACAAAVQKENQPLKTVDQHYVNEPEAGEMTCQVLNERVSHGFLGLPKYVTD